MDPCPGVSGDVRQYQISFQTGSVVATESVNIARCAPGRCSHTFVPPSNPPSSYDSVSVAAENVVGVGAARTCTTQTFSELKFVMWCCDNYLYVSKQMNYFRSCICENHFIVGN